MSGNLYLDAAFVKAQVARLIEDYPELAEDDGLRADTIEGETDAHRLIERALNERQHSETMAWAIKERETAMAARRVRFERKSGAMEALIKAVMKAAKLDKLTLPEATLSILKPRQLVGIENVDDLPQGFFKTERKADKAAIKAAFDAGEDVPGAIRVIGENGLSIRTK